MLIIAVELYCTLDQYHRIYLLIYQTLVGAVVTFPIEDLVYGWSWALCGGGGVARGETNVHQSQERGTGSNTTRRSGEVETKT